MDTVKVVDGAFQISVGGSATRFLKRSYSDNSQMDLALSVSAPLVLRAAVLTGKGEVDVALTDESGRLVDFSNHRGPAPQMLIAKLAAGNYKLSVFTQNAVRDIQIELGCRRRDRRRVTFLKMMSVLSDVRLRRQLSEQLTAGGFSEPPDPLIALGGETAVS